MLFSSKTVLAASAVALSSFGWVNATNCEDTVEIACSLDDFSTLCTAIEAAGLADALSSGHWTVFAPTNAAFDALGDLLDTVLADTALLTDILLFHAVDDAVSSKDLECAATVEMANLQNSRTVCEGGKIYQKGGSNPRNDMPQIIQTDIKTCQGYIHVIDEVMLPGRLGASSPPPPPRGCESIAEIACGMDDFSTLCTAVDLAGLGDALSGGMWTVFAPTNAAFEALDPDLLDTVLGDTDLLQNILLFHVVADQVLYAEDLACTHVLHMASDDDSRTVCKGGDVFQKGAGNPRDAMPEIVQADVGACNGVIHVIDQVMLP